LIQALFLQTQPCGQPVPHVPQLPASLDRSVHIPLQQVSPLGQAPVTLPQEQCPPTQVSFSGQAKLCVLVVQPPQLR
jgi:hypothetical protein